MRRLGRRLRALMVGGTLCAAIVSGASLYLALGAQMPAIYSMADYHPPSASQVISADGLVIGTFAYERRTPIAIETLPAHVRYAFLAAEDADFYRHEGIDWWGVLRAVGKNLRPGAHLQGASTITQQTVKTLIVGPERSVWRKVREAILARRLEQLLGKDAILGLYLNQIYFGHGAWGIEEAAQVSFGKSAAALDVAEAATLAAAPKHPARYSLDGDRAALFRRRRYVLTQMAAHGWLAPGQVEPLSQSALPHLAPANPWPALCRDYVEHVRRLLVGELGEQALFAGGLRIHVGLDAHQQRAAMAAVRQSLEDVGRRRRRAPRPWLSFSDEHFAALLPAAKAAFSRRDAPPTCTGCPSPAWTWSWRQVLPAEPDLRTTLTSLPRTLVGRRAPRFGRLYLPVVRKDPVNHAVVLDAGTQEIALTPHDVRWVRTARGRPPADVGELYRVGDVLAVDVTSRGPALEIQLAPRTDAQAALVAIDPHTRLVRALVGAAPGSNGAGFNRATQARRQPGSAFKPILYATALSTHAITPASLCQDAPIEVRDPHTKRVWRPDNYEDGHFDGPITFREALTRSKNTCSVRLMQQVGTDTVRTMAQAMGIDTRLPNNLPLALGTGEVTPLALTNAMATLAAGGQAAAPRFIDRVLDARGQSVWQPSATQAHTAMPPEVAFVATSMLQSVVQDGTGRRARLLERPLAGKTGTSQDARDTWFTGFAPSLVASTWIGFDDNASLGRETGASAALPAWIRFMGAALANVPAQPFVEPPHVKHVRIDPATGAPIDAVPIEVGDAPPESEATGGAPTPITRADDAEEGEPDANDEGPGGAGIDEVFVEGTEPNAASAPLPSIYLQDEGDVVAAPPEMGADVGDLPTPAPRGSF